MATEDLAAFNDALNRALRRNGVLEVEKSHALKRFEELEAKIRRREGTIADLMKENKELRARVKP